MINFLKKKYSWEIYFLSKRIWFIKYSHPQPQTSLAY